MNKRFSTLLGMSLLLSSAFSVMEAKNLKDVADDGQYYKIMQSAQHAGTKWNGVASNNYGLVLDKDGNLTLSQITEENLADASWTITSKDINGVKAYMLVTASGHTLENESGATVQQYFYSEEYKGNSSVITGNPVTEDNACSIDLSSLGGNNLSMLWSAGAISGKAGWNLTPVSGESKYELLFNLVATKEIDIPDSDLNELYNKKGFSFDLDSVVGGTKRDIEN